MDLAGKADLLRAQKDSKELPLSTVADLLDISRSAAYYEPNPPSVLELKAKNLIDSMHTEHPTWGSRQLSKQLKAQDIPIGRLKTRRYMKEMGITVIYPKPNLSKPAQGHKIFPYLLRNAVITRPNQAWSIDITYIRLEHGFVYLTAIIDWYSRCIVGWDEVMDKLKQSRPCCHYIFCAGQHQGNPFGATTTQLARFFSGKQGYELAYQAHLKFIIFLS